MWQNNGVRIMLCIVAVAIVVVMGFSTISAFHSSEFYSRESAAEQVYAGEIVNKRIANAKRGFFNSTDMDYQLEILYSFEHNGEQKTASKSISVDKETYQEAEIGMWFDSQSLEITPAAPIAKGGD